jgi:tetraacyldisaccharide 4'-kinase
VSLRWRLTAPLRLAGSLRRRGRDRWPRLPRPAVSVGNLALGGRCKTPVVVGLVRDALAQGLRPAVLTRGYGGSVRRGDPPEVVVESGSGAPWLLPVRSRAARIGDEPAWLAAVLPGVPVAVHPDRGRAAAAALEHGDVDLFVLDDGLQAAVERDVDLVLLDGRFDPPFARKAACREGDAALQRADLVAVLEPPEPLPDGWLRLTRRPGRLRALSDGREVEGSSLDPVTVAAAVGQPASVATLARAAGLTVRRSLPLRDHRAPGPFARAWLDRRAPLLITEKDAMGWAATRPPAAATWVLEQRVEGVEALWPLVATRLTLSAEASR